jgi:hypothetical protein
MGIIALILAILAFILVVVTLQTLPIGLVLIIIGAILAIVAILRNRRKVAGIIALVFCGITLIVVPFSCIIHSAPIVKREMKKRTEREKKKIETVKIGKNVQVGEVRWKVLEVEKKETIEKEFGESHKAKGIFVLVKLEAEMVGKESGSISESQFKIVDSKNRTFKPDRDASWELPFEERFLFEDIQPNVPITGWIAFDIAKDATELKLKIEDLRVFSDLYAFIDLGI